MEWSEERDATDVFEARDESGLEKSRVFLVARLHNQSNLRVEDVRQICDRALVEQVLYAACICLYNYIIHHLNGGEIPL